MLRVAMIELVREDPSAHGVFSQHARTYRRLRCTLKSVTRNEAYQAMSQGLNPAYVFVLSHSFEYKDERLLRYDGNVYKVLRAYVNGDSVELTAERVDNDV